jgi:hypothetical protein
MTDSSDKPLRPKIKYKRPPPWLKPKVSKCTVCAHRERAVIELGIARRISVNALAKRYGLHHDALYRHSKNHMPPQLRAKLLAGPDCELDLDQLKATESQSLLGNLVAIRHRLFGALDLAEECGDVNMMTRATSQLHQNLEIAGKLLGDLGVGQTNITNVLILPAYVECVLHWSMHLPPFPRQGARSLLFSMKSKARQPRTSRQKNARWRKARGQC